jgi:hypothetical protein
VLRYRARKEKERKRKKKKRKRSERSRTREARGYLSATSARRSRTAYVTEILKRP